MLLATNDEEIKGTALKALPHHPLLGCSVLTEEWPFGIQRSEGCTKDRMKIISMLFSAYKHNDLH